MVKTDVCLKPNKLVVGENISILLKEISEVQIVAHTNNLVEIVKV